MGPRLLMMLVRVVREMSYAEQDCRLRYVIYAAAAALCSVLMLLRVASSCRRQGLAVVPVHTPAQQPFTIIHQLTPKPLLEPALQQPSHSGCKASVEAVTASELGRRLVSSVAQNSSYVAHCRPVYRRKGVRHSVLLQVSGFAVDDLPSGLDKRVRAAITAQCPGWMVTAVSLGMPFESNVPQPVQC